MTGFRVLIVEDEYLLANELCLELADADMEALGPARDVASARAILRTEPPVDAALLDINLRGHTVYELADELAEARIPFVFVTGYDRSSVPARFSNIQHLTKPLKSKQLAAALDFLHLN